MQTHTQVIYGRRVKRLSLEHHGREGYRIESSGEEYPTLGQVKIALVFPRWMKGGKACSGSA
jgi:hypothetical protein